MRILFLVKGLTVGGIETNLVLLCRELGSRGHQVTVAGGGGRLTADVLATGATHVPLGMSPHTMAEDAARLRRALGDDRPDVAHVFSTLSAVVLWMALRWPPGRRLRPPPPVVSSVMGLDNFPGEALWRVMLRVYLTSLGADRVVVISPAIDRLLRRLPIRTSRLVHQPVAGVDLPTRCPPGSEEVTKLRRELAVTAGESVVMTIGRLEPRKSHRLFVQMAGRVLAGRDDARFFVVGEGALRAELEDEIERLGIGARVALLGERTDLTALLSMADVYVRPGVVEGFVGLTVLHAQALDVPVVSFDTDDVRLAVTDGETGLLVAKDDVAALAAAVTSLLDDAALAERLAKAGHAHVQQHFALPPVVDGLEALYRTAIDRRP